jgi:hypothetical protein
MEDHTDDFTTSSVDSYGKSDKLEVTFMLAKLTRDVFLSIKPTKVEQEEFQNECRVD